PLRGPSASTGSRRACPFPSSLRSPTVRTRSARVDSGSSVRDTSMDHTLLVMAASFLLAEHPPPLRPCTGAEGPLEDGGCPGLTRRAHYDDGVSWSSGTASTAASAAWATAMATEPSARCNRRCG